MLFVQIHQVLPLNLLVYTALHSLDSSLTGRTIFDDFDFTENVSTLGLFMIEQRVDQFWKGHTLYTIYIRNTLKVRNFCGNLIW